MNDVIIKLPLTFGTYTSCSRWQRDEKWKNDSGDEEPKWRQNEKWKNNL